MDLIRELKDVRFELNLRGYDCDAVDAFLAKVRSELAELESEREADRSRLAALEDQVSSGESDTEGTLRRTLILAQRLADETVADARQVATEMTETAESEAAATRASAQSEADELLASANHDAERIRSEAQAELDEAHAAAEQIRNEAAAAADLTRSVASDEAERLLEAAEASGAERVATLESVARVEIAAMREPIREEVRQLEETRLRLRADISALDEHLLEQRTRVRDAVASLRQGMSGSIDDLERVAADEQLMSTITPPETSDAGAADVPPAPEIDIAAVVAEQSAPAPSAEALAQSAAAAAATAAGVGTGDAADDGEEARAAEDETSALAGDAIEDAPEAVTADDDDAPAVDATHDHMMEGDEAGEDATELIPVVETAGAEVVDLDSAPSPLFETDVHDDHDQTIEATSSEVIDSAAGDDSGDSVESTMSVEEVSDGIDEGDAGDDGPDPIGFIQRFNDALSDLPLSPRP